MDRTRHFSDVVRAYRPHADVIFDAFRIITNYHTTVDAVRKAAWHDAEKNGKFFIKGQPNNLFARKGNLKPKQQVDLDALPTAHALLSKVYILDDQLITICKEPTVDQVKSAVQPIQAFTASLLYRPA